MAKTDGSDYINPVQYDSGMNGLTKREYFAAKAMAAYASADYVANSGVPCEEIARFAVAMADALIEALNKEEQQ